MFGLISLAMHGNHLSGQIPSEIGQLVNLGALSMDNNTFTGLIPQELAWLVLNGTLAKLTIDTNQLSGVVPESLCYLGPFNTSTELGLAFDCGVGLCGCDWCRCEERLPADGFGSGVAARSNIFLH